MPRSLPMIDANRTVLCVVAHADDATLFCGGTLAVWADGGARVVVLRVTDDALDSVGVGKAETAIANAAQFRDAMRVLGVAEVIELGLPTDTLGDASEVALRERLIFHVRRERPFAMVSFDPYGAYHEDNQDHVLVAKAVDETYWTAMFDKHHPEHAGAGLQPHGVYERWYFARRLTEVTTAVDIGATLGRKIEAALCHELMLRNMLHQMRLQAATADLPTPGLDKRLAGGEMRDLFERFVSASAADCGARHGLEYAEEFRVVRPAGLETLLAAGEL